jgi:cytochrome c553
MATLAIVAGGSDAGAGDAEKGRAKAVVCIACHGATGAGARPEIPHLAGQNQTYLIAQMKALRRTGQDAVNPSAPGLRADVVMGHQAAALSDADIDDIAAYYSSRSCVSVKTGDARPLPALVQRCVSCHGPAGRSTTPTVPRLAGQQEIYLQNQLMAFRESTEKDKPQEGERRARHHPVMSRQASLLSEPDIGTLAHYFSSRTCE